MWKVFLELTKQKIISPIQINKGAEGLEEIAWWGSVMPKFRGPEFRSSA